MKNDIIIVFIELNLMKTLADLNGINDRYNINFAYNFDTKKLKINLCYNNK